MQQPAPDAAATVGERATACPRQLPIISLIALILLLAGYGFSFWQVSAYESGMDRQSFTIHGALPVPVIHLVPAARQGDAIAVIVHGYSGSKELMIGFGIELARMGIPSYLLDLPGHGESTVPLQVDLNARHAPQLETALDIVVQYARAHSDVPNPKIVLLGHSLGTLVVGDYALAHPGQIAATILVSPILQDLPTPTNPANLLVIVGQGDIPSIITQSPKIIGAGCGQTVPAGAQRFDCGNVSQGTGRRFVIAPGVNHITILTDADAYTAMDAWVAATDGILKVPVESNTRLYWTELGVACAFLALFPLLALLIWLLGLHSAAAARAATDGQMGVQSTRRALWARLGIVALGVLLTVLLLRGWAAAADSLNLPLLRTPLSWIGMTLADYTASFSLLLAILLGALLFIFRRKIPWPSFAPLWRQMALGLAAFLFLYLTVGTLATYAWQRFLLDGPRLLRFIPLALASAPLFLLLEGFFAAEQRQHIWRAILSRLGAYLLICAGLVGAIILDPALTFLSLLVPIQALLFIAFAMIAVFLHRQKRTLSLSSAVAATLIFAWSIAAVFPITGP